MRLMSFQFSISHIPGKNLVTTDALSWAPSPEGTVDDNLMEEWRHMWIVLCKQFQLLRDDLKKFDYTKRRMKYFKKFESTASLDGHQKKQCQEFSDHTIKLQQS